MKTIKNISALSLLLIGFTLNNALAQDQKEVKKLNDLNKLNELNKLNDLNKLNNLNNHDYDVDGEQRKLPPVQYKVPNSTQIKKVVIKDLLAEIKIIGSQSNEIVIDAIGLEGIPARAKSLKPLYANGCMDNTGAGVAANESGGVLTICGASKGSEDAKYTFTIPKGIAISIDYNSPFANEDIEIKDMEGEVEASTLTASIKCINVTGPLVLNSTSGDMEISLSKINQNSPTSISLISGDLDISIPATSPINLELNTITGATYTDFEIKMDSKDANLRRIGGNNIETKLNGGGVEVNLSSTSGNIYLRKK